MTEAATSPDITNKLIYNWKTKLEEQQSGKSLKEDERAEPARLRKDNSLENKGIQAILKL